MIRPNELPTDTIERQLSDEIVRFLTAEVSEHGDAVYYWFRQYYLEEGIGLAPYDVAAARFLKENFPGVRTVEIGAGMAELSALMAALGFDATAIDKTPQIMSTAEHLQTWLGSRGYPPYKLLSGWFPHTGGDLVDGAVVMGMSIQHETTPKQWSDILDALAPAKGVVMDLTAFFLPRKDEQSMADLAEQIMARGFAAPVEIYRWGPRADYNFTPPGRIVYFAKAT